MPIPSDLRFSSVAAAHQCGSPTASALVRAGATQREAAEDNPVWIHRAATSDQLAQADTLMTRAAPGSAAAASLPLYGLPCAIKDNIDVAGMPTTAACPAFSYTPDRHAAVVERLVTAGALIVGKTNLDQFATGLVGTRSPYGAVQNSFDSRYISGGSSSGSAVAVSLGQVAFALGTDTAGSGRIPAAFNDIVGLKPTRGRVSTNGMVAACRSLDCVSVFALNCADAAQVLRVIEGYDDADPYSRRSAPPAPIPTDGFKFALPQAAQLDFCGDQDYRRLFEATVRRLAALGGTPIAIDFTPFLAAQTLLYDGPWVAERTAALGDFLDDHAETLDPVVRQIIEAGRRYSAVDAFRAQYRLAALRRTADAIWDAADILVVPGAPTIFTREAVAREPVALNAQLGRYTNFVNLLDLAALTVPTGYRADGLPFGVTLIGPAFADEALLALGARLHAAACATSGACRAPVPAPVATPVTDAPGVRVAVVGAHLSGLPLNHQLTGRGARLVRTARTAPHYRLYALADQLPPKPGLVRVARDAPGASIEVEIWELPSDTFGAFVAEIPAPLGIGTLTLEDGESVKGFLCEPYATAGREDITAMGGWRKFAQLRLRSA